MCLRAEEKVIESPYRRQLCNSDSKKETKDKGIPQVQNNGSGILHSRPGVVAAGGRPAGAAAPPPAGVPVAVLGHRRPGNLAPVQPVPSENRKEVRQVPQAVAVSS